MVGDVAVEENLECGLLWPLVAWDGDMVDKGCWPPVSGLCVMWPVGDRSIMWDPLGAWCRHACVLAVVTAVCGMCCGHVVLGLSAALSQGLLTGIDVLLFETITTCAHQLYTVYAGWCSC
jgi:hypothetical protein